ncbi:MAG TPA: oligosaccharide flippase family protein [Anaerolineae bacterium]|nr:oligosaccharide flippase family protein [Anaerolineae bacterium]
MFERLRNVFYRLLENELIRRIVKNAGYLFSATGISAAMSMFQSILAGRMLGPANFGILGTITTFTSVVNRFASFRMNELVVRYVGNYQEKQDYKRAAAVFKTASLLEILGSLVAFLLIWLLAPIGSRIFTHQENLARWFVLYGSIVLVNMIYESATGLLQIFDRFRTIAMITAIQSTTTLLLIIVIYIFHPEQSLTYIILAYMSGKIVGALSVTFSALLQATKAWGRSWWKTPLGLLRSERRSLLTFAFSTNISSTVSLIAKDSDVLWVSSFLGTTAAGYYKVAIAISNLLQLPISPLPKATYPELTREIARRNWTNVRYILKQGSRLAGLYSLPMSAGLLIFGKWIITILYGGVFIPAYAPLMLLLIGFTFANIFYWNRVALLALARPVFPTIINFSGMIMKVAIILMFSKFLSPLFFAGLLSGYYLYTVGIAVMRVFSDVKRRDTSPDVI